MTVRRPGQKVPQGKCRSRQGLPKHTTTSDQLVERIYGHTRKALAREQSDVT